MANDRTTTRRPPPRTTTRTSDTKQPAPKVAGEDNQLPAAAYTVPAQVSSRGITESQWLTLRKSLYPGALPESILMVVDYCKARKLDPMKKPCHIVPMEVATKVRDNDGRIKTEYQWRDVVMPGIYEYRTTAMRTGLYLGHTDPEYGDWIEYKGVLAPEWCRFTVLRWNPNAKVETRFPVTIFFNEIVNLTKDGSPNKRWSRSPHQMLTKCAEAAALRETFPDELGGEHTMEEMEGRVIGDFDDRQAQYTDEPAEKRVNAATEALRTRVNSLDKTQESKKASRETQSTGYPQKEADPWEKPPTETAPATAKTTDGIAEWVHQFEECKSIKEVDDLWKEATEEFADDMPVDIEAAHHMMVEHFSN